jgi:hypothetical protein
MSPVASRTYDELDEEIIREVQRHWDVEGCAPTLRELAARLQVPSTNTVMLRVRRLALAGRLKHDPGKARTIRIPRAHV